MLIALAYVGFLINLFNLLPIVPLDGGRAMAAMAPWMWFVGFGALLVMLFTLPFNPILLIIVLFGGFELYRRWKLRKTRSPEQEAYYRVAPRHRLLVGVVYIGLAAALAVGMAETHLLVSGGHSFGHLRGQLRARTPAKPGRLRVGRPRGAARTATSAPRAHRPFHVPLDLAARGSPRACRRGPCPAPARSPPSRGPRGSRSRVGTIVRPRSLTRASRRSISPRCASSLRSRSGSWFSRAAGA